MNRTPHQTFIQVIKSRMGKVRHMACMENRMGAYRVLVGRPEGNRPLGKYRHRWEENIKVYLQNMRWGRHRLHRSGSG